MSTRPKAPDIHLNDTVRLRKAHPCGAFEWRVTRVGADIGLICMGCGRRIMLSRHEFHRRLKHVVPDAGPASPDRPGDGPSGPQDAGASGAKP